MSVRLLSTVLFVSSLAFAAAAEEPAAAAPAATTAAAPADTGVDEPGRDPEKIICKASKPTGTRLAKRSAKICRTRAEWDRLEQEQRLMNQDMNQRGSLQGRAG